MEMKTKRNGNDKRTVKSVVAVLQMINIYQRKLKKAQSCHSRIAPWSKAIFPSSDVELVDGTLLVKGRSRDIGLLERFALNSENQSHLEEATEACPKSSDTCAFSSKMCTRNVKYQTLEGEVDDEDDDSDFETSKIEEASKRSAVVGWLASKFSSTKEKLSLSAKKPKLIEILEEMGGNKVKEPMENDAESDSRESELKTMSSKDRANEEMAGGKEPDKNEKTSLKRRVMKAFGKKLKHKPQLKADSNMLLITSDHEEDNAQSKAMVNELDDDQTSAPQRKKKKTEEPMFSCPMCGIKFVESEINQHAFTCNPEPRRESRSKAGCSNNNTDFIPLAINSGTVKASVSQASTSGLSAGDKEFSEWQTACKKVLTGKKRNAGRVVADILDVDLGSSIRNLVGESSRIDERSSSKNGTQKKAVDSGVYRKEVKPVTQSVPKRDKKSAVIDDHRSWMSDESEDANDLVEQYLDNEEKENLKRKRWSRNRPGFIEEDSQGSDQKCFICSSTFCGESELDYEAHVKECIAKEEARLNGIGNEDSNEWLTSQKTSKDPKSKVANDNGSRTSRLNQRLGNRKSWAKLDEGVDANEDSTDDVDVSSENDSPVKAFKPISDSNLFNFENQFKTDTPRNGKKRIPKRMRKRRKLR